MQIKLLKRTAEAIGEIYFRPWGINKDSWGWKEEDYLDLATMERDKIDALRKLFAEHEDVKGVKTIMQDIDTWLNVLHDKKGVFGAKARSPRQLAPLLITALGENARHQVYERVDNMGDVHVAYYVEQIRYHPRTEYHGEVTPEHVTMDLYWEEFQGKQEKKITFWPDDCRGISVQEALGRQGFFPETPVLRKRYESEIRRWRDLISQVGKQCLAYGTAKDDCDGNPASSNHWYWRKTHEFKMAKKDGPTRVLVDIFKESDEKERDKSSHMDKFFWTLKANLALLKSKNRRLDQDDEEQLLEDLDVPNPDPEVPIHPYLCVFDLKKHLRLRIHVSYLADYQYDKAIIDRLILPADLKDLVKILIEHEGAEFKDIVEGKSGGAVVLLTGKPGVGKTLTAEVYAESEGRGLYSVQCSQLGTDPASLEEELLKVFARAQRWGAVMLLDEADVYVRQRGSDLQQNAIVGVFLRVLEYQGNVLFLTTNRPDDVDDAIASRCVARLNYNAPSMIEQAMIWRILANASKIELSEGVITQIVVKSDGITGRDVKNLLKLANLLAISRGESITAEMVEFAKKFKPTGN